MCSSRLLLGLPPSEVEIGRERRRRRRRGVSGSGFYLIARYKLLLLLPSRRKLTLQIHGTAVIRKRCSRSVGEGGRGGRGGAGPHKSLLFPTKRLAQLFPPLSRGLSPSPSFFPRSNQCRRKGLRQENETGSKLERV